MGLLLCLCLVGNLLLRKSFPTCDFSENKNREQALFFLFSRNLGGSRGARTPDLLGVNEAL